jgi:hypothetical protein
MFRMAPGAARKATPKNFPHESSVFKLERNSNGGVMYSRLAVADFKGILIMYK